MEFPLGNFNAVAVENMETEGFEEVEYVYNGSEMLIGGSDDFSSFTPLLLEDGTRAMIVDGTLLTSDGQTLILQDESDLTDGMIFSKEQEEHFLQIFSSDSSQNDTENVIHFIQDDSNIGFVNKPGSCQDIFYIQQGEDALPIQEEYQIAELNSEDSYGSMEVINLQNDSVLEGVQEVIDLDELLENHQASGDLDGNSYHYAILKDGKFHLRGINESFDIVNIQPTDVESEAISEQSAEPDVADYLDLSAIKGRNTKTGQVITLSRHMDKVMNKKLKALVENKEDEFNADQIDANMMASESLQNLINKRIPIGQTDQGKMLVGKIVNVIQKPEASTENNKTLNDNLVKTSKTNKKTVCKRNRNLEGLSKMSPKRGGRKVIDNKNRTQKKEGYNKTNLPSSDTNQNLSFSKSISMPDPHAIKTASFNTSGKNVQKPDCARKPVSAKIPLKGKWLPTETVVADNSWKSESLVAKAASGETSAIGENEVVNTEADSVKNEIPSIKNSLIWDERTLECSSECSNIIFHKKVMPKGNFDGISRTLTGLMNMDSVVKRLRNKSIIIKIIEKIYDEDISDYSKKVSYCSGYMVREYKLDEQNGGFSENWKFIPDANATETILEQNNQESCLPSPPSAPKSTKRFVNLTIQITVSPEGIRTTRVTINPPALFRCKACTKSYRTNALLKVHLLICPESRLQCSVCFLKFKTIGETKIHSFSHRSNTQDKNIYECLECKQSFGTPLQIKKHMATHCSQTRCPICKLSCASTAELNRHMLTHSEQVSRLDTDEPTEREGGYRQSKPSERKVFSCQICSRQFSRHSNLQRHVEIHQGEGAMYQCAVCSCSYHYISSLTRHVVSCHVDKSKKAPQKQSDSQNNPVDDGGLSQDPGLQFLQDDQIGEMLPLETMNEDYLQQYVTDDMEYVSHQGFEIMEEGKNIFPAATNSSINVED